jgi:hypothetical protein
MADNKSKKDGRDRSRVNSKEGYEVEYLHQQYPDLSHQQVYGAIRAAGPVRKDIVKYLKDKGRV